MGAVICIVILGECGATFISSFLRTRLGGRTARDRPREGEGDTRNNCRYMGHRETREGGSLFCVAGRRLFARVANPSFFLPFLSPFRCPGPPEKKVEGKTTGAQKVLLYWWYQQKRGKTFFFFPFWRRPEGHDWRKKMKRWPPKKSPRKNLTEKPERDIVL